MKKAIQKAIEGGYKIEYTDYFGAFTSDNIGANGKVTGGSLLSNQEILLDPLFWQALGKAEGWNDPSRYTKGLDTLRAISGKRWLEEWHLFINHLAEGKSADSFFEELLK